MKCSNCGADNDDGARACGLCNLVFPPPVPKAAPPPPAEPKKIDTPQAAQAVMLAAMEAVKRDDVPEAKRLMTRVFRETIPSDGAAFLGMAGDLWLESLAWPADQAAKAKTLIASGAALAGEGRYQEALAILNQATAMAAGDGRQHMLFPLLVLGVRGAADAAPRAASGEPAVLDSPAAVDELFAAVIKAVREERALDAKRMAGRFFEEVSLPDCAQTVLAAGGKWLETAGLDGGRIALARRLIESAADMVLRERFAEALPLLRQCAQMAADNPNQHPTLLVLFMGVESAMQGQARRARYRELVDRGVKAMASPGGKAEAASLFEQALALLPAPPRTDAERGIRAKLEAMIRVARE